MKPRVRAVWGKELTEYRRNKLIVFTMAGLPLIFVIFIALMTFLLPERTPPQLLTTVTGQALLMFLLIPVILPTTVASYAVIGEREQGTLEPVLTTPATDRELLVGKALAATVPAVALAWGLYAAYGVAAAFIAPRPVIDRILSPDQIVAQIALAPTLALFGVIVGMLMSARTTDVRVAQQLSGLAILPVMGLLALVVFGPVRTSVAVYLGGAALLLAVDLAGWRLLERTFDRERLLTRFGA